MVFQGHRGQPWARCLQGSRSGTGATHAAQPPLVRRGPMERMPGPLGWRGLEGGWKGVGRGLGIGGGWRGLEGLGGGLERVGDKKGIDTPTLVGSIANHPSALLYPPAPLGCSECSVLAQAAILSARAPHPPVICRGIDLAGGPVPTTKVRWSPRQGLSIASFSCCQIFTAIHTYGQSFPQRGGGPRGGVLDPPLCDIPSGCCSFTGPWTVTRSSLRMLRRVAAFCRPVRPVLLLVSFPRSRSPVVGVLGLW